MGIFFVFILSIIPLFYLQKYFNSLAERQDSINEELIKEQLLDGMSDFQNDLKPETYIENALKALELNFNFPDLDNPNYKFTFTDGNRPDYIKVDFIPESKKFLKNKYGIAPFLFICCNYDFKDITVDDPEHIFKNEAEKERFSYALLGKTYMFPGRPYIFKPVIASNKNNVKEALNRIHQIYFIGSEYPSNAFLLECAKNISLFNIDLPHFKGCNTSFSNKHGNQLIFQYFYPLIAKEGNNVAKLLGAYFTIIKSSDISINKFLENIIKYKTNKQKYIKREIVNESVKSPIWEINEKFISYKTPFPSHFSNFIENKKNFNNDEYNKYKYFLSNNAISVSIDKSEIKNNFRLYQNYCEAITNIVIILLGIILLNSVFNLIKPSILLSLKIRAIVLIAVTIPVIGLWFTSILVTEKEQNLRTNTIEKIMSERLLHIEKYVEDILKGYNPKLLEFKKFICDKYYESSSEYFWGTLEANKILPGNYRNDCIGKAILLDKSGKAAALHDSFNDFSIKFSSISNQHGIMSDMHILDENSSRNKKNNEQYMLFSSYTDSYHRAYNSKNILARESYIIPSENVTTKYKVSYMLIADKNNPNKPDASLYTAIASSDFCEKILKQIKEKHPSIFSQHFLDANIEYAIFERREDSYLEPVNHKNSFLFTKYINDAANKAIKKKTSHTEISNTQNNIIIKECIFQQDSQLLLIAAAIMPKTDLLFFSTKQFALLLVIYAILAVALLSDLLSGALLAPINALTKFVTEISHGHYNVNTQIGTGDEMEELGDSFNKMSEGLCEREKLKRFVSDKLYSSLATNNSNQLTTAKVTILSSDIRSFTTISEKNEPEAVVTLLNDYFTLMEKSIVKYGGSIEKIIGDAISATFYEEKSADYALNACKAALEMRESLKLFNKEREKQGLFTIENGIGLATGNVMIGFAGQKSRRREFLLMGSVLREAETLESMTKTAISSKIFIDKNTYSHIENKLKVCALYNNKEIYYRELSLEQ